jgi:hypothetical protein
VDLVISLNSFSLNLSTVSVLVLSAAAVLVTFMIVELKLCKKGA